MMAGLLMNHVIGRRYEMLSSPSHLPQNYLEAPGFVQHDRKTSLLLHKAGCELQLAKTLSRC